MGFTATYPGPAKTHPTAKNRVWGFSAESNRMRPANRRQAPEPRRKSGPTATKTASGVSVYGYRYYNPSTGRWVSRDPIEENGGANLYAFVGNDGVSIADYLGLAGYLMSVWKELEVDTAKGTDGPAERTLAEAKEKLKADIAAVEKLDWSKVYNIEVRAPGVNS